MVVYICPIKDSLLEYVVVKGQARQIPDIQLGCFLGNAAKLGTIVINSNLYFVFWRSGVHCSTKSNFSIVPMVVIKSDFKHSEIDFSNKVLFSSS